MSNFFLIFQFSWNFSLRLYNPGIKLSSKVNFSCFFDAGTYFVSGLLSGCSVLSKTLKLFYFVTNELFLLCHEKKVQFCIFIVFALITLLTKKESLSNADLPAKFEIPRTS